MSNVRAEVRRTRHLPERRVRVLTLVLGSSTARGEKKMVCELLARRMTTIGLRSTCSESEAIRPAKLAAQERVAR